MLRRSTFGVVLTLFLIPVASTMACQGPPALKGQEASSDTATPAKEKAQSQPQKPQKPTTQPGDKPGVAQARPPLSPELASAMTRLTKDPKLSEEVAKKLVTELCQSGDVRVLPALETVLSKRDDPAIRRSGVMGVVQGFDRKVSADFFMKLVTKGDLNQQRSALYGLAYIDHPDVYTALTPFLSSKDKVTLNAAYYAMAVRGRHASRILSNSAFGQDNRVPMELVLKGRAEIQALRATLKSVIASEGVQAQTLDLVRRFGNRETVEAAHAAYTKGLSEGDKENYAPLVKFLQVNHRWAGRPSLPGIEGLSFDLVMENLAVEGKEPKRVSVQADLSEFEESRNEGSPLDRACQLDVMVDYLMATPQACQPKFVGSDESGSRYELTIPENYRVRMAVGFTGTRYWEGKLEGNRKAVVTIDKERGVPLREEIFDSSGKSMGIIHYKDFRAVKGGGFAPSSIEAKLTQAVVGAKRRKMDYTMNFTLSAGEAWLPVDVTVLELGDGGAELKAVSHTENMSVQFPQDD